MADLNNKKILACCANGAGSSLMMEKAIDKVLKKFNIKPAELRHCPIAEGKTLAKSYDVVLCAKAFASSFTDVGDKTLFIPLKNVMSAQEIEDALKANGYLA